MFTVTLSFADDTLRTTLGDTGKVTVVPIKDIAEKHPDVVRMAAIRGFVGALNDISRGKAENGKANSDDVWAAARDKRVKPWTEGSWAAIERAESQYTAMREQYYTERAEAAGLTRAEVDKTIRGLVTEMFGKDENATFSRFLDAVARQKAAQDDDVAAVRATIEEALAERTRVAAEARKAVAEGLKTKGIKLDAGL